MQSRNGMRDRCDVDMSVQYEPIRTRPLRQRRVVPFADLVLCAEYSTRDPADRVDEFKFGPRAQFSKYKHILKLLSAHLFSDTSWRDLRIPGSQPPVQTPVPLDAIHIHLSHPSTSSSTCSTTSERSPLCSCCLRRISSMSLRTPAGLSLIHI